jgi:hypothetical protein
MNRLPPDVERAGPTSARLAPKKALSDSSLVFDAIYTDFQARRIMLRAFAEMRGDDDSELLW